MTVTPASRKKKEYTQLCVFASPPHPATRQQLTKALKKTTSAAEATWHILACVPDDNNEDDKHDTNDKYDDNDSNDDGTFTQKTTQLRRQRLYSG